MIHQNGTSVIEKVRWSDDFGQRDMWSFCLNAARMAAEPKRR